MKTRRHIVLAFLLAWTPFVCVQAKETMPLETGLFEAAISRDVPPEAFVYNWRDAVLMKSFIDIYRRDESRRERVAGYVGEAMTRVAPKAHGRHPNGIAAACGFAFLKEIGRSTPETDAALERVYAQYKEIVRTEDGACSHRPGRLELWDDTLYMLDIFLLGCYRATGDISYVEEFADQLIAHAARLRDPVSNLWYHGWAKSDASYDDACCQKGWNANPQHRNAEFWGRGNGWVAMAMADLLEVLPADDPRYPEVRRMFSGMMKTVLSLQQCRSGLWYQLPARLGEKGNFLESSCTAMFAYAAAKGFRAGVLGKKYFRCARKAYKGLLTNCVRNAGGEEVFLDGICEGTCIGDKDYYFSRKAIGAETYATGAFLMLENQLYVK